MAVICRNHRLLFIMVPRTGSTSVRDALIENAEGEDVPRVGTTKHMDLAELMCDGTAFDAESMKELFKFCCVRNPYERLVSHYEAARTLHSKELNDPKSWVYQRPSYLVDIAVSTRHSFSYWVIRKYLLSALRSLVLPKATDSFYERFTDEMDFVMRFERLDADFAEVLRLAGFSKQLGLPHVNASKRVDSSYRRYYSLLARAVVAVRFRRDFRRYSYRF
jgi:hypothetical protein